MEYNIPEWERKAYEEKAEKFEKDQSITFTISKDKNGIDRPTEEERKTIIDKLEPIRQKAENEIAEILNKITKEHSIYIWTNCKEKIELTFIYPSSNLVYN
jgi:hypothetical protein